MQDFRFAISQYARRSLRDVIGQMTLDQPLAEREQIESAIARHVERDTGAWGLEVVGIRMEDIDMPEELKKMMSRQASAEREKRANMRRDGGPLNAESRVARAVRLIDRHPDAALTLGQLARAAGPSPYHFLRTFKSLVGITPHQYVLRARLREAASRLATDASKVLDVALDCGFGDVSNFNRAFHAEFAESPLAFRRASHQPIV